MKEKLTFGSEQREGRRNQRFGDQYGSEKIEIISQKKKRVISEKMEADRKMRVKLEKKSRQGDNIRLTKTNK